MADDGSQSSDWPKSRSRSRSATAIRVRALVASLWVGAATLLAGCSNDVALRKAELQQLAAILPGHYDNRSQSPPAAGGAETALELNVAPIYAPFLSDHVFYVQENAFGDPRRVLSQRLFVFDVTPDNRIRQRTFGFAEPLRWRDGHLNTDLFKGMMGQDVGASAGACVLDWQLAGQAFTGRARGPCVGAAQAELTGAALSLGEPPLRFERRR